MDGSESVYQIESNEQLRVVSDDLRQRILSALSQEPMTVTQVGEQLRLAPAKVHYHVRELERVGLVKLVETREKGGILEKYYAPIAEQIRVSPRLFQGISRAGSLATIAQSVGQLTHSFIRALSHAASAENRQGKTFALFHDQVYCTRDEFTALIDRMNDLAGEYRRPRGVAEEQEYTMVTLAYDTLYAAEAENDDVDENVPTAPASRQTMAAGVVSFSRKDFEHLDAAGDTIDIAIVGFCRIADDVPADLVERTVASFRHRGILSASDDVRDVLLRKEALA